MVGPSPEQFSVTSKGGPSCLILLEIACKGSVNAALLVLVIYSPLSNLILVSHYGLCLQVLNLDGFITHELPFHKINEAFGLLTDGKALRCLLLLWLFSVRVTVVFQLIIIIKNTYFYLQMKWILILHFRISFVNKKISALNDLIVLLV